MKKFIYGVIGAAFLLAACSPAKKETIVSGTVSDASFDGKYAYIYMEDETLVDSALIEAGKFKFAPISADSAAIMLFSVEKLRGSFISEPGDLTITINPTAEAPALKVELSGATLTNSWFGFMKTRRAAVLALNDYANTVYADSLKTKEEKDSLYQIKEDELVAQLKAEGFALYNANKDNILGRVTLEQLGQVLEEEEYIQVYEEASDIVKSSQRLTKRYEAIKQAQATKEGVSYADFTAIQADGTEVLFSSFIDGKSYLLVDFWASWCGPCKAAMPYLRATYDAYKDKGLRVLGVATWDKAEDYEKAKAEHGVVWESIFDKESAGATTYGVNGIPHLMLISPEGTILKREINPKELNTVIAEYIK